MLSPPQSRPQHGCLHNARRCQETPLTTASPPIGLQRTDNGMDFTTWPQVNMINQKNYYTYVLNLYLFLQLMRTPVRAARCSAVGTGHGREDGRQEGSGRSAEGQERCLRTECAICAKVFNADTAHFCPSIDTCDAISSSMPSYFNLPKAVTNQRL